MSIMVDEFHAPPDFTQTPERVDLVANPGLPNAEAIKAFFNPPDLRETISVEWSRLPVIGLDHEVIQYSRTKSIEIPMSFYFSAYEAATRLESFETLESLGRQGRRTNPDSQINSDVAFISSSSMNFANFFRSLCFPTRLGLRPPTIRIHWPNVLDLQCVVASLTLLYHKFDRTLAPVIYQADVTVIETRLTRRYSEEVRQFGLMHTEPAEGRGR